MGPEAVSTDTTGPAAALGCRTLHRGPVAAGEARGAADAGHGIDDEAEHGQAAASPKYLRR